MRGALHAGQGRAQRGTAGVLERQEIVRHQPPQVRREDERRDEAGRQQAAHMQHVAPAALHEPEGDDGHARQRHLVLGQRAQPEHQTQREPGALRAVGKSPPAEPRGGGHEGQQHRVVVVEIGAGAVVGDAQRAQQRQRGEVPAGQFAHQPPGDQQRRRDDQRPGRAHDPFMNTEDPHQRPDQDGRQRRMLVVAPFEAAAPEQLLDVVPGRGRIEKADREGPQQQHRPQGPQDVAPQDRR